MGSAYFEVNRREQNWKRNPRVRALPGMTIRETEQARATPTQGRNEQCKCSSGLKFKKCCGKPRT